MKPNQQILEEVFEKYGEYIEMMGDKAPVFVIETLCGMILKEREMNIYYKRRLENVCTATTN